MSLNINNFVSEFQFTGARANLFKVTGDFPSGVGSKPNGTKLSFLIKAASLPASTIAPIEINFRGRKVQYAGDRSFEAWTITVLNDNDFAIRNAFESWSNILNNYGDNTARTNVFENYTVDWEIDQLNKQGRSVKNYKIRNCWPASVSNIEVSYDNENTIEDFTVELQFLDFIPNNVPDTRGNTAPTTTV